MTRFHAGNLWRGVTVALAATLLVAGCSPTPAALPTAKPAKPAEAAKPATAATSAPEAKPAAAAPQPAAPAAASPAAAAPAASPAAAPVASPAAAAPAAPSGPTKTVNIVIGNNLIGAPWYVGVDKGIWVKRGLDVRPKQLVQGSDQVNALQAKEADFGYQVNGALLPALEQGLQVIVIASAVGDATRNFADDAFTLIGGPKVKTVADLKGKKLGMVAQGTSPPFLRSILAKNGMTYDQVEIINVPQANHPQALATGQIDALVTIEPYGVMALDATKDATLLVRGGGNVSFAGTMVTRPDVIAADPDTVQKMVDGFAEAAAYVRQNPNEAVSVASRWISGLDQNATQRAIKFMYYDPRVSTFTKEGLEADMKALLDAKTLKAPIDLAKYMNLTYINKTLETHPEFFSDLKPAPVLR